VLEWREERDRYVGDELLCALGRCVHLFFFIMVFLVFLLGILEEMAWGTFSDDSEELTHSRTVTLPYAVKCPIPMRTEIVSKSSHVRSLILCGQKPWNLAWGSIRFASVSGWSVARSDPIGGRLTWSLTSMKNLLSPRSNHQCIYYHPMSLNSTSRCGAPRAILIYLAAEREPYLMALALRARAS
jgi:hypothetical protein